MSGRPIYVATDELRERVAMLSACGMSHADIAGAIGCNHQTLRKYYRSELKSGAAVKRAEIIGMLVVSAKSGSVPAQKHLESMTRPAEVATAAEMGKKEKRQARAEKSASAGKFAAPTAPKLVVNNGR